MKRVPINALLCVGAFNAGVSFATGAYGYGVAYLGITSILLVVDVCCSKEYDSAIKTGQIATEGGRAKEEER